MSHPRSDCRLANSGRAVVITKNSNVPSGKVFLRPEFSHVTMHAASPYLVDFEIGRSFCETQRFHLERYCCKNSTVA
jgi:hypothetical protein